MSAQDGPAVDDTRTDSEARLRLAIDAGRMAIWEWDEVGQILAASPELNRLLGFPEDHPLTMPEVRTRYPPGERERVQAAGLSALGRGERHFEAEFRYLWPDGSTRWLLMRADIRFSDGMPAGILGVLIDVTERRRAEEALAVREAELRDALAAAAMAVFDIDHRTRTVSASPRLAEIYGYPTGHLLTLADLRARYHPQGRDKARPQRPGGAHGPYPFETEYRLLLPDGSVRWLDARGEHERDAEGVLIRSRGVVLDITERKRADERQELLINELNHRVKNMLATVQSLAAASLKGDRVGAEVRQAFEQRLFALARAHDILTRENWEAVLLREIVDEVVRPHQPQDQTAFVIAGPDVRLPSNVALSLAMGLHELCTNAVKYGALSRDGGHVSLLWRTEIELEGTVLHLTWQEKGGPAVVTPTRTGFGTRLLGRGIGRELNGAVRLDYEALGLRCDISFPLP